MKSEIHNEMEGTRWLSMAERGGTRLKEDIYKRCTTAAGSTYTPGLVMYLPKIPSNRVPRCGEGVNTRQ